MRPAVLVDVDGVLNAIFKCNKPRPTCKCHPEWTRVWAASRGSSRRWKLTLNPAHGPLLRGLAAKHDAELVWASYWQDEANDWVSPVLGLPSDLPHVPIPSRNGNGLTVGAWKALNVARWANGRPFVWFEDEPDAAEALKNLEVGPNLLVPVVETVGLASDDVERASAWLRDLAGVTANG